MISRGTGSNPRGRATEPGLHVALILGIIFVLGVIPTGGLEASAGATAGSPLFSLIMEPEAMDTQRSAMEQWLLDLGFVYDETLGRVRNPFDFPRGEADPALKECFVQLFPDMSRFVKPYPLVVIVGDVGCGKSAWLRWLMMQPDISGVICHSPHEMRVLIEAIKGETITSPATGTFYFGLDIDDAWCEGSRLRALKEVLTNIAKWRNELPNIVFRVALPAKIRGLAQQYRPETLDWSAGLLNELLKLRLSWASRSTPDLRRFFQEDLSNVDFNAELTSIAQTPRRMFELGQNLLNIHFASSYYTRKAILIEKKAWEAIQNLDKAHPFRKAADISSSLSPSTPSEFHLTVRLTYNADGTRVNNRPAATFPAPPEEVEKVPLLEGKEVRDYGKQLFRGLIFGEDLSRYTELDDARHKSLDSTAPIYVHIVLPQSNELLAIPWELLHDDHNFLVKMGAIEIIRHLSGTQTSYEPRKINRPLRILYMAPRPADRQPVPVSDREALDAVKNRQKPKKVLETVDVLPPTYERLREMVTHPESDPFDILHYDGHGTFGFLCSACKKISSSNGKCSECGANLLTEEPEGYLLFEDRSDQYTPSVTNYVSATDFATLCANSGIPVAFLSACYSATTTSGENAFNGLAARLMLVGFTGVIGIQGGISAAVMREFVQGFYEELVASDSSTLISAVAKGRKWLGTAKSKESKEDWWHLPVLYLREGDTTGRVFRNSALKRMLKAWKRKLVYTRYWITCEMSCSRKRRPRQSSSLLKRWRSSSIWQYDVRETQESKYLCCSLAAQREE